MAVLKEVALRDAALREAVLQALVLKEAVLQVVALKEADLQTGVQQMVNAPCLQVVVGGAPVNLGQGACSAHTGPSYHHSQAGGRTGAAWSEGS